MATNNPYSTPVTVTIRRVLTQSPNWIGGQEPEVIEHTFGDLQLAYLFCVKEAGLDESEIRGSRNMEIDGWDIIPFIRLKEILAEHQDVEAFYAEDDDSDDYISMRLAYAPDQ